MVEIFQGRENAMFGAGRESGIITVRGGRGRVWGVRYGSGNELAVLI